MTLLKDLQDFHYNRIRCVNNNLFEQTYSNIPLACVLWAFEFAFASRRFLTIQMLFFLSFLSFFFLLSLLLVAILLKVITGKICYSTEWQNNNNNNNKICEWNRLNRRIVIAEMSALRLWNNLLSIAFVMMRCDALLLFDFVFCFFFLLHDLSFEAQHNNAMKSFELWSLECAIFCLFFFHYFSSKT